MIIQTLRIVNVVLAIASVPFSVFLLKEVIKDEKQIPRATTQTNLILRRVFALFSVSAIVNAVVSIGLIFDSFVNQDVLTVQSIFNLRNFIINFAIFITSYGLYQVVRKSKNDKTA